MYFTRTAVAAMTAAVIASAMIGLSAVIDTAEAGLVAGGVTAAAPQPWEAESSYTGIEPYITDPPARGRYYPEIGLDAVTQDFIFVECAEATLDYELVLAVIIQESGCNPDAVSSTGDYGLMQINKCNHAWLAEQYGITDIMDPRQNIIAGITILSQMDAAYGDGTDAGRHKTLMAYNMGPTGAARAWASGQYSSKYSIRIMQIREDLINGTYQKGA